MIVKVEASQSEIGQNDILLRGIKYENLRIRLSFMDDNNLVRTEIILTLDEVDDMIHKVLENLHVIEKAYNRLRGL